MNPLAEKFLARTFAKGDVAEVGLLAGATFLTLCRYTDLGGDRTCYGFDSFEGMGEPGPKDLIDGKTNYPKGKFYAQGSSIKGLAMLRRRIVQRHQVYMGWVPEVFAMAPSDLRLCFAYLDVDHYQPTVDALAWIWPRIESGGIMLCHDVIPGQDIGATLAVNEWAPTHESEYTVLDCGPKIQMAFQARVSDR